MTTQITDTELRPGEPCPVCGGTIRTWFARKVRNPDEMDADECWVEADDVERTGISSEFAGNIVFIDHHGDGRR